MHRHRLSRRVLRGPQGTAVPWLLLVLLVLPFWISYLMRMLAWTNLLQNDGMVNHVLRFLHLQHEPTNWLDGDGRTVVWGLVYGYLPFFILPLYSTLERIDGRLIEAGATWARPRPRRSCGSRCRSACPG